MNAKKGQILVIVESPTKARTISRFLSSEYNIQATLGHIRDLPQSASDVPKDMKSLPWTRLGIDVENDFKPLYIQPKTSKKTISALKKEIKECSSILLATDEDREGESICWHLLEVLKPKKELKRIVFHEITSKAIHNAIENARDVNMQLVRAQETRRILDRLYGYTLSPLIWKKIAFGLSAGRVQSPALRMIVERERERIRFISNEYWDIKAELSGGEDVEFHASLSKVDNRIIVGGKHYDATSGVFTGDDNLIHIGEEACTALCAELQDVTWQVTDLTTRNSTQRPSPPFITSTLQQEGNRKLGLSARQTMRYAQQLYEKGLITYMRTDSPSLSQEAISAARSIVETKFGSEYLSPEPRQFAPRSAQAQEAHEAIRPAGADFKDPDDIGFDTMQEQRIYTMIYQRTLATQMAEAKRCTYNVHIVAGRTLFNATATVTTFPGFLRASIAKENADRNPEEIATIQIGSELTLLDIEPREHHTKPPARFNEASLIQKLEGMDIGRPSTYSSIISTLYDRKYVEKRDNALIPTFVGIAVIQFLEEHFKYLIEYQFTSQMEEALDKIANGDLDYLGYLKDFFLKEEGLRERTEVGEKNIDADPCRIIRLPYDISENIEIRVGRYGPFVVFKDAEKEKPITFSLPNDLAPAELDEDVIQKLVEIEKQGPIVIGVDPETGKNIYCLYGRYGHHLQLGETDDEEKPKRATLKIPPEEVDLEYALKLLSLPRKLGKHPESGKEIRAAIGPYGPYIVHDGDYRSLKKHDVYTISLEESLEILAQEKKLRRRRTKK